MEEFKPAWINSESKSRPTRTVIFNDFSQLPPEEFTRTPKIITNEAKKLKFWVFDPKFKKWYSPEEFLLMYDRITKGEEELFKRVEVKDPINAITEAFQILLLNPDLLEPLSKKIMEFSIRVAKYYRGV